MNEKKQWVQHISGVGEKWEMDGTGIVENETDTWAVIKKDHSKLHHYLPKSEYRICEPPEVWEDVTEDTKITSVAMYNSAWKQEEWHGLFHECSNVMWPGNGYRLRKVQLGELTEDSYSHLKWAFIVEKKAIQ